jgi:putative endonuclease
MYFVYILKSLTNSKFCISSSEDLKKRLIYHNSGKVKSTKAYRLCEIIYTEIFDSKVEALKRGKAD